MSGKKQKLRLIHARHNMPAANQFRCGGKIPESGIYRVVHNEHRLAHEVTLLSGQLFPKCMKCEDMVYFELVRGVPDVSLDGFKVALYTLPAADDEEAPAVAS
jgi:hypothetical protein